MRETRLGRYIYKRVGMTQPWGERSHCLSLQERHERMYLPVKGLFLGEGYLLA